MSKQGKGYAGKFGIYYPAESCHIPAAASHSMLINKIPPEQAWAAKGGRIHIHIKNLRTEERPNTYCNLIALGGYSANTKFAMRITAFETRVAAGITTSIKNTLYFEHWLTELEYGDVEMTWENGKFIVTVDGVTKMNTLCEGDELTANYNSRVSLFSIWKVQGASFDLVDATFDDGKSYKCSFIPMRTADGKHHAILESSTQTVVEI